MAGRHRAELLNKLGKRSLTFGFELGKVAQGEVLPAKRVGAVGGVEAPAGGNPAGTA